MIHSNTSTHIYEKCVIPKIYIFIIKAINFGCLDFGATLILVEVKDLTGIDFQR